jgi:hypothetical protein
VAHFILECVFVVAENANDPCRIVRSLKELLFKKMTLLRTAFAKNGGRAAVKNSGIAVKKRKAQPWINTANIMQKSRHRK